MWGSRCDRRSAMGEKDVRVTTCCPLPLWHIRPLLERLVVVRINCPKQCSPFQVCGTVHDVILISRRRLRYSSRCQGGVDICVMARCFCRFSSRWLGGVDIFQIARYCCRCFSVVLHVVRIDCPDHCSPIQFCSYVDDAISISR